jgi:hypothetical protein
MVSRERKESSVTFEQAEARDADDEDGAVRDEVVRRQQQQSKRRRAAYEDNYNGNGEDVADGERMGSFEDPSAEDFQFDAMPTAEELAAAASSQEYLDATRAYTAENEAVDEIQHGSEDKESDSIADESAENFNDENDYIDDVENEPLEPFVLVRQTLLFSATAIQSQSEKRKFGKDKNKNSKKFKLKGTLKGVGQNVVLPDNLKQ